MYFSLQRFLWLITLFVVGGCGPVNGTMSGKVTFEGEPVQNGAISFLAEDGSTAAVGGSILQGNYEVSDIPPGPKVVKIEAVREVQFAKSSAELAAAAAAGTPAESADLIPSNAVGNHAKVTVTAGTQKHDFQLSKPTEVVDAQSGTKP